MIRTSDVSIGKPPSVLGEAGTLRDMLSELSTLNAQLSDLRGSVESISDQMSGQAERFPDNAAVDATRGPTAPILAILSTELTRFRATLAVVQVNLNLIHSALGER